MLTKDTKAKDKKTLNENQQLVLRIAKDYPGKGGRIDWKKAYAEHPEWKSRLTFPSGKPGEKGFLLASQLRKMGYLDRKVRRLQAPQRGRKLHEPSEAARRKLITARQQWVKGSKEKLLDSLAAAKENNSELVRLYSLLKNYTHCPSCGYELKELHNLVLAKR